MNILYLLDLLNHLHRQVTEGDIDTYTVTVSYDGYTRSAEIQLRYYSEF